MTLLVLNINVRTQAHRDTFDKELCIVMPVGEFCGGELVMVEQGLIFLLQNADFAVFWCAETTHFNMNYTGHCCSLVMQTDKEFDKWVDHRNGWSQNIFLN